MPDTSLHRGPGTQEASDLVRASHETERTLVSQVRDYAIFAMDREGHPVSWNEGVEALLGYGREEFIGSAPELLFLPEDVAAHVPQQELQVAIDQGTSSNDRWLRRRDGSSFYARGRTARLADAAGRFIGFTKVLRDETERLRGEQRLRASEERFRVLVENIRDYAILLLDADGIVTEWTSGAEAVLGYTAAEVVGRDVSMLYTEEQRAAGEPQQELDQTVRDGRTERETWRLRKGGERFWANEIYTVIRGADGSLLGFVKVCRDVSERKRAEEALREEDRRKDAFLATLAHELRNPLAPLRNGLAIARLTIHADSALQDTMSMMERQVNQLVRLVDDLLDMARINSGKLALRRRPLDMSEVLSSSVQDARPFVESHRQQLSIDTGRESLTVTGDFDRLVQVFTNLLHNAAKYSEPGGSIRVSLVREDGEAVAQVSDTGIGIPAADLPHVFDLFSQVRSHQGRSQGGLGIGLALVASLVALHGGRIEVRSEGAGRGSVFRVRLPLLEASAAGLDGRRARPNAPTPARADRVLVVDDNVDSAASLAALVQLHGHQVQVAYDGLQALEIAQRFDPSLVLLDLGMPRMDGLEAARRLRRLPRGGDMKIVALTGWGQPSDRERTRAAGFDAHLVKPVDAGALAAVLAAAAEESSISSPREAAPRSAPPGPPPG